MDAIGEDAVPDAVSGFEQVLEVPVQLVDVPLVGCSALHDVRLELNARVVDVEIHPAWVADSRRSFGGHFGGGCYAGDFHEPLEGVSDVVLRRVDFLALYDEAERFRLFGRGHQCLSC